MAPTQLAARAAKAVMKLVANSLSAARVARVALMEMAQEAGSDKCALLNRQPM